MANENKNIKELVSEDNDPTAELEILGLPIDEFDDSDEQHESDAHTHGLANRKRVESALGQSIPELQSDLESRTKTIGKLQYDIQQLRAKWLGLEAEISAREEIVSNLLQETSKLKKKVARKDSLLKKRRQSIRTLKSEIIKRNEDYDLLEARLGEQASTDAENVRTREETELALEELRVELEAARTELATAEETARQRDEQYQLLEKQLAEQRAVDAEHITAAAEAELALKELRVELDAARADVASAEADIEQRDEQYRSLEQDLEEQRALDAEHLAAAAEAERALEELRVELDAARAEIVSLEANIRQRDELFQSLEKDLEEQRSVDAQHVAAVAEAERALEALRVELDAARAEIEIAEADSRQHEEQHNILEQRLAEQQAADAEHVAEHVAALEDAESTIAYLRSELAAATHDEFNLNTEVNRRDELQSLLEEQNEELERQLSNQRALGSENIAALQAAQNEIEALTNELEAVRNQGDAEIAQKQQITSIAEQELQEKLIRTEEYADSLRWNFQDLGNSVFSLTQDRDNLRNELAAMSENNKSVAAELVAAKDSNAELRTSIEQLRADHEQELRTLRFELGEAQESVAQTTDLNSQLASDLIDTRGSKEELEQMLARNEGDAQQRITVLETELKELENVAEEFEQKLDTKNTAINVLLGELSKKTEQIDSIGEIEDVIQEIDSRMSEKIDEPSDDAVRHQSAGHASGDRDRITRVLVGNVGDQELRFPLFKDRLTIGRTAENDIQLKTAYISRRHAVVLTEGDATRVIDWGSKNGVYVNSERVEERILSNGDIVSVGNAKFRYEERPKRDS